MVGYAGSGDPVNVTQYTGAGTLAEASHELFKVVPEVTVTHLALTVITIFITFFGLFSGFVKERLYVGEAIIATVFGIAFSGYAAGIFAPRTWSEGHHFDEITLELTRIIIALSVFAVGVELPKAYVLRHWRSLSILLGPVMLCGWMISGALMYAIIPGLEFLPALVVAAGVTPTDPILASSVVGKGKFAQEHVPAHIRHLLQAESGSNDGAAFPFLYLALFLLMREHHSIGETIGYWIALVILYQIVLGIVIGALVGIAARKLLKFSKRRELIDRESMVAMYVALALLVTGLTTLAGSDDLLAAFACGTAFAWDDWFTESIEESNFSSTIDLLANCAMFIYLGATMPFNAWNNASLTLSPWRLVLLAISILALRRLPTIFALQWWIPDIKTRREAIFAGHFGPMGVGAIFISTLAATKLPTPRVPPEDAIDILALTIQPITYFIVLSSILTHGLTISFFSLGRRVHSRVTSISRTFTQASGVGNDNEPSWMSRVKRAVNPADIVVNRDDDDDVADLAEKGQGGDTGALAMFGAPSTSGSGSGSATRTGSTDEKEEDEKDRNEMAHEGRTNNADDSDEHPSKNVLASDEDDVVERREAAAAKLSETEKAKTETAAKERRYCAPGETKTWTEGRKIIIDRNDGGEVEVIDMDPSEEAARKAIKHPSKTLLSIPDKEVEAQLRATKPSEFDSPEQREESALKAAAYKMIRKGSNAAATQAVFRAMNMKPADPSLTPAEREEKAKQKLARDAWCRQEKHYRENTSEPREYYEGGKVVTVAKGGEEVTVRELTQEEKDARAAKHLAALKALGHPIDAASKLVKTTSRESDDYFSPGSPPGQSRKGKGRASSPGATPPPPAEAGPSARPRASPAIEETPEEIEERDEAERPRPPPSKGLGLALTRTIRPDDEDSDSDSDSVAPPPVKVPERAARRPSPQRGNSTVNAMRHLFKRGDSRSPEALQRGRAPNAAADDEHSRSSSPAIRFTTPDRPSRDGGVGTGRPLPVVGSSLSVRRTSTLPRT